MLILLSGLRGSGKTTLAKFLEKMGYHYIEMSDIVKEEMKKERIDITPESLRNFAAQLREKLGKDAVAKLLAERIKEGKNYVVSGIRGKEEVLYLKERFPCILVWIEVDEEIRKRRLGERIKKGEKKDDPKNEEEKRLIEKREKEFGLGEAKEMAEIILTNNGTIEELEKKAEKLISIASSFASNPNTFSKPLRL